MRPTEKAHLRLFNAQNGGRRICLVSSAWVVAFALAGISNSAHSAMSRPAQPEADPSVQSWTVARGDSGAWKIQPDRLECDVTQAGPHWIISQSPLQGDFVIEARLGASPESGEGLFFSAKPDLSYGYLLTPGASTSFYKVLGSEVKLITTWRQGDQTATGPRSVRVVKKGTAYRIDLDGKVLDTITNPGGDRTAKPQPEEPDGGSWGFAFNLQGKHTVAEIRAFGIPRANFFPNNPIVTVGPKGSWDQRAEAFAGAAFQFENKFYLYYDADYDAPPNGIQEEPLHRIGVAVSSDLRSWTKYEKNPVLGAPLEGDRMKFFDLPQPYVFATMQAGGGVVRLPNGEIGLTFNVLGWADGHGQWLGVWLAEAPSPFGPFRKAQPGPILTLGAPFDFDGRTLHLHGTYQLADGTYAMLYTGHNQYIAKGRPGDRGGLATSKDMIHWTKYPGNPVFEPGQPGSWDDQHVRPKTFVKLRDWYYMFYEGAHRNQGGWPEWPDQVGLARSRDLIHWERYPYNPVISTTTVGQSGDVAQIQPAALVSDDTLYVFFGCLQSGNPFAACGAEIPNELLDRWGEP